MNWCVTVEITGEPARVVGPFRSKERAREALESIEAELAARGIVDEIAPSVALMYPGGDWKETIPW